MRQIAQRWLNIKPDEIHIVSANFLQSFFLGASRVFTVTVASTLFLRHFEAGLLPLAYLVSALLTPFIGMVHIHVSRKVPFLWLHGGSLLVLGLISTLFLGIFQAGITWLDPLLAIGLMVWVNIELSLTNLAFWGVANRAFTVRQGKRLLGLVSVGEILISIVGGLSIPLLLQFMETTYLLVFPILSFVLAFINLSKMKSQLSDTQEKPKTSRASTLKKGKKTSGGLLELFKNDYLRIVAFFLAICCHSAFYFADNIFYYELNIRYPESQDLAAFIGQFIAFFGVFNLIVRMFVAGRWMEWAGLPRSMMTSPILMGGLTVLMILAGTIVPELGLVFWLAVSIKLMERTLAGSLNMPIFGTLMQPLSPSLQTRGQSAAQTMFGPAVAVISSLILLFFTQLMNFGSLELGGIFCGILIIWGVINKKAITGYRNALNTSLQRRVLTGDGLVVSDDFAVEAVQKTLTSQDPEEILYALDVLASSNHPELESVLLKHINHAQSEVRCGILKTIEQNGKEQYLSELLLRIHLVEGKELQFLIKAIAASGEVEAIDVVAPFMDHANPELRCTSIAAMIRYCGLPGAVAAGGRLIGLEKSADTKERIFVATIIGEVGSHSFSRTLVPLLKDPDCSVRHAALQAASQIKSAKLWPHVIDRLTHEEDRAVVSSVLAKVGTNIVSPLVAVFDTMPPEAKQLTIRLLAIVKGKHATEWMLAHLDKLQQTRLADGLLVALVASRTEEFTTVIQAQIERKLEQECENGQQIKQWLSHAWVQQQENHFLHHVLQDALKRAKQRAMWLLALLYPVNQIQQVEQNLESGGASQRSMALELLDTTLQGSHKQGVLNLLTAESTDKTDTFATQSPATLLVKLLNQEEDWHSTWILVCTLDAIRYQTTTIQNDVSLQTALLSLQDAHSRLFQDNQTYPLVTDSLARIAQQKTTVSPEESVASLGLMDKVKILAHVPIFINIPSQDQLLPVARSMIDQTFNAGETFIQQGEDGDTLYIILNGRVRIHSGSHTLAELDAGQTFGELSALLPEPRSATVTALEATRVIQLNQASLDTLIQRNFAIALSVIRFLCERLRTAVAHNTTLPSETPKQSLSEAATEECSSSFGDSFSLFEKHLALETVPLFSRLAQSTLLEMAGFVMESTLKKGDLLFEKGDPGDVLYVIVSGQLRIFNGETTIAHLGKQEIIGEMAVLSSETRSASVEAIEDTRLLEIQQDLLYEVLETTPSALEAIIQTLARRLHGIMQQSK